jgi:ketosteroid isomerase-like protein
MKINLVVALLGLSASFPLPTSAQRTNTPDPQIIERIQAIGKQSDEAFVKGDAAALAALCTEDAVLVNDTGTVHGRDAIEKYYAATFETLHYFSHRTTYDPTSPHPVGTVGNGVWETGEWSCAIAPRGEDCGPHQLRGYFASVVVREGETWKVQLMIYNLAPARTATPSTTIAP